MFVSACGKYFGITKFERKAIYVLLVSCNHSVRYPLHSESVLITVSISHIHWSRIYVLWLRLLNASDSVRCGGCDPILTPDYTNSTISELLLYLICGMDMACLFRLYDRKHLMKNLPSPLSPLNVSKLEYHMVVLTFMVTPGKMSNISPAPFGLIDDRRYSGSL